MRSFTTLLFKYFLVVLGFVLSGTLMAQPAQSPLLTRGSSVAPNIVFMFDDSGSMVADYLYQDTSSAAWGGSKPGIGVFGVQAPGGADTYAKCSPEINQLYYDPSQRFDPPFNAAGARLAPAATSIAWAGKVCLSSGNSPLIYRYAGSGPRYDGSNTLNAASSYPKTWTLSSSITAYPPPSLGGQKAPGRTDCVSATSCTYTEELQNFANWYTWFRTRLDMSKNATIQSFNNLPIDSFRLGWGKINTLGAGSNALSSGVASYNSTTRANFFNFLNGITTQNLVNSTPNRYALDNVGKYYQRTDSDGPWGSTPNPNSTSITTQASVVSREAIASQASCRRSNAILVTDGYYNDDYTGLGDVDGKASSVIKSPRGGSYQYSPVLPYAQSEASNTFADVAMKYWYTDLRTDLDNNLAAIPGTDPATWQHLNFWAIGLGVDGTIPQTKSSVDSITSGALSWPLPTPNDPTAIDDMWHATINARGGMLNAGNASQLTNSLNNMVGQILKASASQAGVAVSTINLTSGTKKFVPVYTTGEWTGNMIANNLDPQTGNETTIAWQAEVKDTNTGSENFNTLAPDLSVPMASRSQASRNIYVGTSYSASGSATPFTFAALGAAGLASSLAPGFPGQTVDAVLVNYLRGDRSNEGPSTVRNYRIRAALLGDVVNSTPVLVKPSIDYGYSALPVGTAGASSYAAYLSSKAARAEGALFFGANDGMLHALAENDGREIFAYVPRSVLPNIAKLSDPAYVHRYYVDGPIVQGDFYNGSAWKNIVIGTTGAGAKSVFAIDATNPTSLSAANVLWEIAPDISSYSELGNVLSDVQIGLMRNGQWAAIFGNGYYSASGKAQLFVVNLKDGSLIQKIDTFAGPNNGLGGISLVLDPNNQVIGAYGGDLLGNMWKFDLSSATPGNWNTGFGTASAPVPLYKAKNSAGAAQAITAMPHVMPHPNGGYLVAFGTGKFFDNSDLTVTSVQSAYGLRDTTTFGVTPSPNPTTSQIVGTNTLVQQAVSASITVSQIVTAFDNTTSTQVVTYYSVSSNTITWTTNQGWYFNLPNTGQRTVYPVASIYKRIIRVDTIQPGVSSSDPCSSGSSGVGYNYIIDALTGGSPKGQVLDTNGDGIVNSADLVSVSGYSTSADGRDVSLIRQSTSSATSVDILDLGTTGDSVLIKLNLCANGIVNCSPNAKSIVKRSFRQLFLR